MSLSIDIETYSSVDLKKSGVYAYVDAPDFTILLFAYAFDDEEVKIVDFVSGEQLPENVLKALTDSTIKTAFNAAFERVCINKYICNTHWHRPFVKEGKPPGFGFPCRDYSIFSTCFQFLCCQCIPFSNGLYLL